VSVLEKIIEKKRERLAQSKSAVSMNELRRRIEDADPPGDFKGAISRDGGIKLIAELKKASPSKGLIREDFNPREIARIYDGHAAAISVLTEEDFFQGDIKYIKEVKGVSERPVLRKDFIFDEYQIYESRAAGADAMLLIETALETSQAREYLHMARELGMSVLFEVHDISELERALRVEADIIGINNRDLKTLSIDMETTFELIREMPGGKTVVSESGIETREDVARLQEAGVDAVLVGTAIMKEKDIEKKIKELING
jgi:indole-3-glycerol phosphate synthase